MKKQYIVKTNYKGREELLVAWEYTNSFEKNVIVTSCQQIKNMFFGLKKGKVFFAGFSGRENLEVFFSTKAYAKKVLRSYEKENKFQKPQNRHYFEILEV